MLPFSSKEESQRQQVLWSIQRTTDTRTTPFGTVYGVLEDARRRGQGPMDVSALNKPLPGSRARNTVSRSATRLPARPPVAPTASGHLAARETGHGTLAHMPTAAALEGDAGTSLHQSCESHSADLAAVAALMKPDNAAYCQL